MTYYEAKRIKKDDKNFDKAKELIEWVDRQIDLYKEKVGANYFRINTYSNNLKGMDIDLIRR